MNEMICMTHPHYIGDLIIAFAGGFAVCGVIATVWFRNAVWKEKK